MNELLAKRYIKSIMSYGISKDIAIEIVDIATDCAKGKLNVIDTYIRYGIDLTYGAGFSERIKKII